jgi:DNA-binding NarL/FixJ family response regulator
MPKSEPVLILVVGDPQDVYGLQKLREALAHMGTLRATTELEMSGQLADHCPQVVIVDAGAFDKVAPVVQRVRQECPGAGVVVITAVEHWKVARDVYRAGAAEYLEKSLSRRELAARVESVLDKVERAPAQGVDEGGKA